MIDKPSRGGGIRRRDQVEVGKMNEPGAERSQWIWFVMAQAAMTIITSRWVCLGKKAKGK
jgi:hypothetical protein